MISERTKMTFDLPAELANEMRAACMLLSPIEVNGNISGLVERAIKAHILQLRRKHNGDNPFAVKGKAAARRGPTPKIR